MKNFIVILVLSLLCFEIVNPTSVFAQAKAKKRSVSSSGVPSTTRAKVLGKEGKVVYAVDPNNPPELTALSAEKAVVEALSKTYTFGDTYSDFSFLRNELKFKRHNGSYSIEEHYMPLEAVASEVYETDFRNIGTMYYVRDPHACTEILLARYGMAKYGIRLDDHVLAWKNLDDAKHFLDAVYVLKLAKESKACFSYLARGAKRLAASDAEGARLDALAFIQENPKLSMIFNEDNVLKIYNVCGGGDFSGAIESSLVEAENTEKNSDVNKAFKAYSRAYAFMSDKDERVAKVKDKLITLYSKLAEKPGLPESCRRLRVQAEAKINEYKYRSAVRLLEELLGIAPWWPEGYYNSALLSVQTSVDKSPELILSIPPVPKDYKNAINYMKTYIRLEPGTKNARTGQDKIYEWEMKAGN